MSQRPTKKDWKMLENRKDEFYSLRVGWKDFLIAKAKLVSMERRNYE